MGHRSRFRLVLASFTCAQGCAEQKGGLHGLWYVCTLSKLISLSLKSLVSWYMFGHESSVIGVGECTQKASQTSTILPLPTSPTLVKFHSPFCLYYTLMLYTYIMSLISRSCIFCKPRALAHAVFFAAWSTPPTLLAQLCLTYPSDISPDITS